ncbi:DUF488 domain-containing protein [Streptomyces sp. HMX87]|uniref:DUF488 domain-containing protein n=1 Tax=Streptomyces sp. HMX87 TaxID=3390849 RepID=UPI003A8AABAD
MTGRGSSAGHRPRTGDRSSAGVVRVRRIYDPPEPDDGVRVLVDRLWPRGMAKDAADVDEWPKALTPSTELRRWYHAGEGSYEEFAERYEAELGEAEAAEALDGVRELVREGPVTLLTAAKSPDAGHAAVLARLLDRP